MNEKVRILPAGYYVFVETWENDADNYQTKEIFCRTLEDVKFYVALAEAFRSRNNPSKPGMGNQEVDEDTLGQFVTELLGEHRGASIATRVKWNEAVCDGTVYETLVEDVLGEPVDYDGGFCRVFSSVIVEQQDVTASRTPVALES